MLFVIDLQDISEDLKLRIAMEMNVSETAYVHPVNEGENFQTGNRQTLQLCLKYKL